MLYLEGSLNSLQKTAAANVGMWHHEGLSEVETSILEILETGTNTSIAFWLTTLRGEASTIATDACTYIENQWGLTAKHMQRDFLGVRWNEEASFVNCRSEKEDICVHSSFSSQK